MSHRRAFIANTACHLVEDVAAEAGVHRHQQDQVEPVHRMVQAVQRRGRVPSGARRSRSCCGGSWIGPAPAAMTAVTSSPRRAKSADNRLGAMRTAAFMSAARCCGAAGPRGCRRHAARVSAGAAIGPAWCSTGSSRRARWSASTAPSFRSAVSSACCSRRSPGRWPRRRSRGACSPAVARLTTLLALIVGASVFARCRRARAMCCPAPGIGCIGSGRRRC